MYNRDKEFPFGSSVTRCEGKTGHFWYEACKAYWEKRAGKDVATFKIKVLNKSKIELCGYDFA